LSGGKSGAGSPSPSFNSPEFDWTKLFDTFRYDIDTARLRNSPEYSNKLHAFLDKFQVELKNRGVS